jgi:metacaspase-1
VGSSGGEGSFSRHGANQYYIFEITSDPSLFGSSDSRSSDNFYATWDDSSAPARLSDSTYTLSQDAWDALKNADQLWFRIGTTSSETDWDNYTVSTDDDQGDTAPSLEITGERVFTGATA